jgi:uncharacterized protein (TIGR02145 family)
MKKRFIITFLAASTFFSLSAQSNSGIEEVKIGKQTWSSKNLSVTKFRNGDPIRLAQTAEDWKSATDSKVPAYCYYSFQSEISELEKQKKVILENEKKYTSSQTFSYAGDSLINDLQKQIDDLTKKQGKTKKNASKIQELNTQLTQYKTEKDANLTEWKKTVNDEASKIKLDLDDINLKIDSLNKMENELGKGNKYGFLYNYYAVIDPRGLAPEGWAIPSVKDWDELESAALNLIKDSKVNKATEKNVGPAITLKSSTDDWYEKKGGKNLFGNGNNLTKFNGLPGGWRIQFSNKFMDINNFAYFWTSTPIPSSQSANARGLDCTKADVWKDTNSFNGGLSVRLIKSEKSKK